MMSKERIRDLRVVRDNPVGWSFVYVSHKIESCAAGTGKLVKRIGEADTDGKQTGKIR